MRSMALLLFCLLLGCSGTKRPETVPVAGKVMFQKSTPAAGALIVFHPVNPEDEKRIGGKPFARVKDDGSFTLTSFEENDGAPEGEYGVTVDWRVAEKSNFSLNTEGSAARSKLQPKYGNPQKPFMKVTVQKGQPNNFTIEVD